MAALVAESLSARGSHLSGTEFRRLGALLGEESWEAERAQRCFAEAAGGASVLGFEPFYRWLVRHTRLEYIHVSAHTQGGVLAEPNHPDACHKCHKFGFLLVCDRCEENRCFKCSGLDWPPEESDPFLCETCA